MGITEFSRIVDSTLYESVNYHGWEFGKGMKNPTPLLSRYESKYPDIRPKDSYVYISDGKVIIVYTSQGCEDFDAMRDMITEALKSVKREYPIGVEVGSKYMSMYEFKEFDI